jgi:hypothetical protein
VVLAKLSGNSHNGFPVVKEMSDGRRLFQGLVLRNQLYTLIAQQTFDAGGGELRASIGAVCILNTT